MCLVFVSVSFDGLKLDFQMFRDQHGHARDTHILRTFKSKYIYIYIHKKLNDYREMNVLCVLFPRRKNYLLEELITEMKAAILKTYAFA